MLSIYFLDLFKYFCYCIIHRRYTMNQCDRIRQILKENKLKQKQFASVIGVTESYISKLLKDPNIRLSQSLAVLIEEKYGYNADWVLNGIEPKLKVISKDKSLSEIHQKALAQLQKMNDEQIKAVLAFINSLDELEKSFQPNQCNSKE